MRDLSLEEKIAQMFIIEIQGKEITQATIDMITKYKVGGVILYRRNYDSYEQMFNLINALKKANKDNEIPLFISIDQEGGRVNRMPYELTNIRNAGRIASTKDVNLIKQSASIMSRMLLGLGVNLNYAPVLDIRRTADENHALGNRCFGFNKEDVSKYGIAFMKEMKKEGIIPAIKHFPGHGATIKDSHFTLPVVKKSIKELEEEDMVPFENAIKQGADAVMVGHITVRHIDRWCPASLSRTLIQRYLRRKYKFKGLVITDDLKMLAIRIKYSQKKAVRLAINAGNNAIMLGCSYKEIIELIDEVAKEVRKRKIKMHKIDDSVRKIIKLKKKYHINDDKVKGLNINKMNKEIEELNNKVEELINA